MKIVQSSHVPFIRLLMFLLYSTFEKFGFPIMSLLLRIQFRAPPQPPLIQASSLVLPSLSHTNTSEYWSGTVECPSSLGLLDVFSGLDRGYRFWGRIAG